MRQLSRICILTLNLALILVLPSRGQNCQQPVYDYGQQIERENECNAKYNATLSEVTKQTIAQTNQARNNITTLLSNLNKCSAFNDNLVFAECIQNNYNENQNLLTKAYLVTKPVKTQFDDTQKKAKSIKDTCISYAPDEPMRIYVEKMAEYGKCLEHAYCISLPIPFLQCP